MQSVDQLIDTINKGPQFQRPTMISALCDLDGSNHIQLFRAFLGDKDWHVRLAAAKSLAKILGRDAVSDLVPLLKDKAYGVRVDVENLLDEIGVRIERDESDPL